MDTNSAKRTDEANAMDIYVQTIGWQAHSSRGLYIRDASESEAMCVKNARLDWLFALMRTRIAIAAQARQQIGLQHLRPV